VTRAISNHRLPDDDDDDDDGDDRARDSGRRATSSRRRHLYGAARAVSVSRIPFERVDRIARVDCV